MPGSCLVGLVHPLKVTLKVGLLDLVNIGTGTTMTIVMCEVAGFWPVSRGVQQPQGLAQ